MGGGIGATWSQGRQPGAAHRPRGGGGLSPAVLPPLHPSAEGGEIDGDRYNYMLMIQLIGEIPTIYPIVPGIASARRV
jgi:hypothetical protein